MGILQQLEKERKKCDSQAGFRLQNAVENCKEAFSLRGISSIGRSLNSTQKWLDQKWVKGRMIWDVGWEIVDLGLRNLGIANSGI
jgi:hypothetical protein